MTTYSIPHHFTPEETEIFLDRHNDDGRLLTYLRARYPEWGIIVPEAYGEILVWYDATENLHVVDVTNMSISRSVQQAPFESPDSGFFETMNNEFHQLFSETLSPVLLGAGLVLGVWALNQARR